MPTVIRRSRVWNEFLLAFQFCSVIPINSSASPTAVDLGRAMAFLPACGFMLGLVISALATGLTMAGVSELAVAGVVVAAGLVITGALHEDGLADVVDGLFGGRTRDRKLEIMRDSAVGSFGTLALAFVIAVRLAVLVQLGFAQVWTWLPLSMTISRCAGVGLMGCSPSVRDSRDLNAGIVDAVGWRECTWSLVTTLCVAAWSGMSSPVVVAWIALGALLPAALYRRHLGGITGDCVGACVIATELAWLVFAVL